MSKKIGQALLERKLITPDQLSRALQTQVTRGDRLGVNLLELGMVSERDLGQALGELHRAQATERPAEQGTPVGVAPSDEEEIDDADFGYGRSWRDIAAGMDDEWESLNEQFCAVTRADDAARLLLDRVAGDLANCILFRVTDNTATIWDARSGFVDKYARESVSMPTVSDSLLELLSVRPHYGGPVPVEESYRDFFSLTGLPVPREILLIPVYVGRRPVAILYGDGGSDGTVSRHLEKHVELARQFGLALTLVMIKKKLMS